MKNKIILKIVLATLFICLTIFLVFILSKSMKTEESENVKVVKLNDYNSLKKEVENYLLIGKFSSAPHSDQEPS